MVELRGRVATTLIAALTGATSLASAEPACPRGAPALHDAFRDLSDPWIDVAGPIEGCFHVVFEGPMVVFHADKKTPKARGRYVMGKRVGTWQTWFDNGTAKERIAYRDGVAHGPFRSWDAKGKPWQEGMYRDGVRVGVWKTYFVGKPDLHDYDQLHEPTLVCPAGSKPVHRRLPGKAATEAAWCEGATGKQGPYLEWVETSGAYQVTGTYRDGALLPR